jgi:hypothetical protein
MIGPDPLIATGRGSVFLLLTPAMCEIETRISRTLNRPKAVREAL